MDDKSNRWKVLKYLDIDREINDGMGKTVRLFRHIFGHKKMRFLRCLENKTNRARIRNDIQDVLEIKVKNTN